MAASGTASAAAVLENKQLCIGDTVTIYSEITGGYVYSTQSSAVRNHMAVGISQPVGHPDIADMNGACFEVVLPNRSKFEKIARLNEQRKTPGVTLDMAEKLKHKKAKENAKEENLSNERILRRKIGLGLCYGQVIQLRHKLSGKFIHAMTTSAAQTEQNSLKVLLQPYNGKAAQFHIMSKYKVREEGERVRFGDKIVFESVKSAGGCIHVSSKKYPKNDVYEKCRELNISSERSGFSLNLCFRPTESSHLYVQAGMPIRLFHKDAEAYLCAEGLGGYDLTQDVHFRVRHMDYNIPKTIFPSTSAINYWQIHLRSDATNCESLQWNQQYQIRHMTTRLYLCVNKQIVTLTDDMTDPNTVFKLRPIREEEKYVSRDTYCRVTHVISDQWLHADQENFKVKRSTTPKKNMENIEWTTAERKKVMMSSEMMFADAIILQNVEPEDVKNFNFIAGTTPFIQKCLRLNEKNDHLENKMMHNLIDTLVEIKDFLKVYDDRKKRRQKLLRNLQLIEILFDTLHLINGHSELTTRLEVSIYNVLRSYLKGNSRKNELYVVRHFDFLLDDISQETDIGLGATSMLVELIKDNRKIVDRISQRHIKTFITQLEEIKNYRYLDLLSVLCVCDGEPLPDMQKDIANGWLRSEHNLSVYQTDLGRVLGLDPTVVYVSKDNCKTWTPLHQFAALNTEEGKQDLNYLTHQLDLFAKLCEGPNEGNIIKITEELKYLTWEEAFSCLTDEHLPDDLRAKYCHLVSVLFVNNQTISNQQIKLIFCHPRTSPASMSGQKRSRTDMISVTQFEQLNAWIASFLGKNQRMVANNLGHNMLIEKVLLLVFNNIRTITYSRDRRTEMMIIDLMIPLMSLLDGQNDLPYEPLDGQASSSYNEEVELYQAKGRYHECKNTSAIVNAKYQALEVLELIFDRHFNNCLEKFVSLFLSTQDGTCSHNVVNDMSLGYRTQFLQCNKQKQTFERSKSEYNDARNILCDYFYNSKIFQEDKISSVLMDLTFYKSEKMLLKTTALLHRLYSLHEILFLKTVDAQLLIREESMSVLREVEQMSAMFRKLSTASILNEEIPKLEHFMTVLTSFCYLDEDHSEPHGINQRIIYNEEILSHILSFMSRKETISFSDGMISLLKKCCVLLEALSLDNLQIQQKLFDNLEMLLNVTECERELATALIQVFTGNKTACLKIQSSDIDRIVYLAASHCPKYPEFLHLLKAVVKIEDMDMALRRNQDYVMKYVTQYRPLIKEALGAPLDVMQHDKQVLMKNGCPVQLFVLAVIDLFATCAEGENSFIESICQSIASMDILLDILADKDIAMAVKWPHVKYLLFVYIQTGKHTNTATTEIRENKRMWIYLDLVIRDLKILYNNTKNLDQLIIFDLLRKTNRAHVKEEFRETFDILYYTFDAVMPLIEAIFSTVDPKIPRSDSQKKTLKRLASLFKALADRFSPAAPTDLTARIIIQCLQAILKANNFSVDYINSIQAKYGQTCVQRQSFCKRDYEEMYKEEIGLNIKLNFFAENYKDVYGNSNTIKAQIGYPSTREYSDIGDDEELPLGSEFQKHLNITLDVKNLNDPHSNGYFGRIVAYLRVAGRYHYKSEKAKEEYLTTTVKVLQLIRGLLYNEIIKIDEQHSPKTIGKMKAVIAELQNMMCRHDIVRHVAHYLSSTCDEIVREVLALLAKLLYNGNRSVQESLFEYFGSTREEKFFITLKTRLQIAAVALKEKHHLKQQHESSLQQSTLYYEQLIQTIQNSANIDEGTQKEMESLLKVSRRSSLVAGLNRNDSLKRSDSVKRTGGLSTLEEGTDEEEANLTDTSSRIVGTGDAEMLQSTLDAFIANSNPDLEYKDDGYLELMLQVMALMCDGQYKQLQDYLHYQSDNFHSVDMVTETSRFLAHLYSDINKQTVKIIIQLIQALVEFAAGNRANQLAIFNSRVCDYLDYILQIRHYPKCDTEIKYVDPVSGATTVELYPSHDTLTLRQAVGALIQGLTEENYTDDSEDDPNEERKTSANEASDVSVPEMVLLSLDADSVFRIMMQCHHISQTNKKKQLKELAATVGFQYYIILQRMLDLSHEMTIGMWYKLMKCKEMAKEEIYEEYKPTSYRGDGIDNDGTGFVDLTLSWLPTNNSEDETEPNSVEEPSVVDEPESDYKDEYTVGMFRKVQALFKKVLEPRYEKLKLSKLASLKSYHREVTFEDDEQTQIWNHYQHKVLEVRHFYDKQVLTVEVLKDDEIHKVFFPVKNKSALREEIKEAFNYGVNRGDNADRMGDFMDWCKDIIDDITYTRKLQSVFITRMTISLWWHLNMLLIALSFLIFFVIAAGWKGNEDTGTVIPDERWYWVRPCILWLGIIHNVVSVIVFASYYINVRPQLPTILELRQSYRKFIRSYFIPGLEISEMEMQSIRHGYLETRFFSMKTMWYLSLVIFSAMGSVFYGYFFAVHMLHIAEFNQLLQRAIKAITRNGAALLFIYLFGLAFFYIYALISFAFYRELFEGSPTGLFCETVYECFVGVHHGGLVLTLYESPLGIPEDKSFNWMLYKAIVDLSFFIIITTIGLNIIFGIIVDTFAELRDKKWETDKALQAGCFICGRETHDFETQHGGFQRHIKTEHNQWSYMFFFLHLYDTNINDYTALELYIRRKLDKNQIDFFPLDRAMCLEGEVDESEMRLMKLESGMDYLIQRLHKMEAEHAEEMKKVQNKTWETANKDKKDTKTRRPKTSKRHRTLSVDDASTPVRDFSRRSSRRKSEIKPPPTIIVEPVHRVEPEPDHVAEPEPSTSGEPPQSEQPTAETTVEDLMDIEDAEGIIDDDGSD